MTANILPELKKHRYNVFPEMQPEEFERLRSDIFVNGYDSKQPIWVYEGAIIDGWNRYQACKALGVKPTFKDFEGSTLDAVQFIVRSNNRRDLSSSQRAAIAVEAEDLIAALKNEAAEKMLAGVVDGAGGRGNKKENPVELIPQGFSPEQTKVRTQLAQTFGTNPRYVSDAAKIKAEAPEAFKEIKAGNKTITEYKKEKKEEQRQEERRNIQRAADIQIKSNPKSVLVEPLSGNWYELGRHWLYCGDNRDSAFIEKLPKAAFAFADPPYNAEVDEWDSGFIWEQDYLINADIVAVTPGIGNIKEFFSQTKMPYKWSCATWIKNGMTRGALGFGNWIYTAIFSSLESIHRNSQDFSEVTIKTSETDGHFHKGKKPNEYIAKTLYLFTEESDIVIDPFLGSGTTLLMSERMGRTCYGAEISPEYCKEIINQYNAIANGDNLQ